MTDDQDLIRRAMAAYYRSGHREGLTDRQINIPANDSYVTEHDGKAYVVLRNIAGVLAVYRVRTDGILKGLKRWPRDVAPAGDESWSEWERRDLPQGARP